MGETVRIRRALVAGTAALLVPLGGALVACGDPGDDLVTATVAEDCDLEDQRDREDDCGYWRNPTDTAWRTGDQPDATWIWVWYGWVVLGKLSFPTAGWKAPHNLRHPTKTVRVNRRNCALGALAPAPLAPRPPAPRAPAPLAPKPPANNGGAKPPANGGNNRPVAPKPPVYRPPAGQRVSC